jgi:hypothetical protein
LRQKKLDEINYQNELEKFKKNQERNKYIKSAKKRHEDMINDKRRKTLNKLRERERITNEVLEKKYMENQERFRENELKFIERENYIKNMKKG